MLGVSGLMVSSGDGAADGGASGGSSEAGAASSSVPGGGVDESGGGGGGNRWPRQETLALLKIRSDMDTAFRDSSLKGPLWEEVSRKMAEVGYRRSAKKCKEKFENVYKYHKRTKDGRASRSDAKTYRFFDQLEALDNNPPPHFNPPRPRPAAIVAAPPPMPTTSNASTSLPMQSPHVTVPSTASPNPVSVAPPAHISNKPINSPPSFKHSPPSFQPPPPPPTATSGMNASNPSPPPQIHTFQPQLPASLLSNSTSTSSTSSDEDTQRRRGRKRKWRDFFERLMKDVIQKQEDLQKKFLDALEKRERDRMAREEAWRLQEMARMNREHELLVQERSVAAAKDSAVIAFLQKVTEQQNLQPPIGNNNNNNNNNHHAPPPPPPPQVPVQASTPENPLPPPPPPTQSPTLPPPSKPIAALTVSTLGTPIKISPEPSKTDNGGDNSMSASSSRWPKAEVEALINLRKNLDLKYQDNGPKGPLWEEISSAMGNLGYNRSSKRCKEKWENINKYFKKVKESNKKRPEDSKTCPYFHQLDALYKEKTKSDVALYNPVPGNYPTNPAETQLAPIMARPEQQWPLPSDQHQQQPQPQSMPGQQNLDNDREDYDDEDEEDEAEGFEIVANKQAS